MASIFKRNGTGPYRVSWFDVLGKRREKSTRTTDLAAARRIASKIESDLALRKEGVIDAKLDRFATEARRPIGEHVADFLHAVGGRVSKQQAAQLQARIARVLQTTTVPTLGDLSLSVVEFALGELRRSGYDRRFSNGRTRRELLSPATVAYHAKAMRQFSRWLTRDGRVSSDPLVSLRIGTTDADSVYRRRELTGDELDRVVRAAEKGPTLFGMTGKDRASCYRLACGTGFRANELRSLRRESFDLDADRRPSR